LDLNKTTLVDFPQKVRFKKVETKDSDAHKFINSTRTINLHNANNGAEPIKINKSQCDPFSVNSMKRY
jgi:hypothetical protein